MLQILRNLTVVMVVIVLAPLPSAEADHEDATACNVTHEMSTPMQTGGVSDADYDVWRHPVGPNPHNFVVETTGVGKVTIRAWHQHEWGCNSHKSCSTVAGAPCALTGLRAADGSPHVWISVACDDCFGTVRYAIQQFQSITIPP